MLKTTNGLLERILEPVSSSLNEEAARKLIGLKADRKLKARVAKLAEKCNEGDLTPEERREYELYVTAGHFVAILQAKARILLPQGPARMRGSIRALVRARAGQRCEYCRLHERDLALYPLSANFLSSPDSIRPNERDAAEHRFS